MVSSLWRLLMGLTSLLFLLTLPTPSLSIKFVLPASRYPSAKCIWNAVHDNQLVIVTANIGAAPSSATYSGSGAAAEKAASSQRVDIEIVDSSPKKNVYLHKKGIKGETRLAITTHADGEVGVCLKNYVEDTATTGDKLSRIVDLDVDIGADAIDYNAIANQESLSGLETEMRKIEALVKELIDDMTYLKKREERFRKTNISTRRRVQNFAWFTIAALGGLGLWQILHLRSYFKKKYLID
ncbi:emp24/gp25L/p24 family/GOLD-domain-containing protein [Coprinopsis sp. MPI-PUGE-AT-0042]|nr:emp24/gp25L/p24 family/GOLD-domain-containing protein [Coprinopsis sp. MPI-PUGE-AT-0042]